MGGLESRCFILCFVSYLETSCPLQVDLSLWLSGYIFLFLPNCFIYRCIWIYFKRRCELYSQIIFYPSDGTNFPHLLKNTSPLLIWHVFLIIFSTFLSFQPFKHFTFWTTLTFPMAMTMLPRILSFKKSISWLSSKTMSNPVSRHKSLLISTLTGKNTFHSFLINLEKNKVWLITLSNSSATDRIDRAIDTTRMISLKIAYSLWKSIILWIIRVILLCKVKWFKLYESV